MIGFPCPFISWQSTSICGRYGGRDNIRETSWGDICSAETLFSAPNASRMQPLSDNKAPACPHRTGRWVDRRTWKNYWWADKVFCYLNSLPLLFILLCCVSVCLPNSIPMSQSASVWLSYFQLQYLHCLSDLLLPLSLSPSVSHCISVSITLPSFFHSCE